ncbi:hypothetical protein ES706_06065 [subsurface metagenome]
MLGKLKSKFINWLLKDVHLQELHIGEHSVVVSGTGINMGATKVENVAAPDSDDDAPRRDTIDSKITTHAGVAAAHHAVHLKTLADHALGTVVPHDALASLTEKAHGSLTGVTTSQHHTKYTDAQAKAAAVQSGVITNGVTKAPTHDAVYDVKQTADAAQTSAEVDSKILTHKNISSAHHTKYTHPTTGACPQTPKAHTLNSHTVPAANISMNSKRLTTLGTPTSAGDALRKGTRVTVAELPAMTDEKIWKGTGDNVEEVDMPSAGEATTFEVLNGHGDVGTGADQVAVGNHTHTIGLSVALAAGDNSTQAEAWAQLRSVSIPSSAKKVIMYVVVTVDENEVAARGYGRGLYNGVERCSCYGKTGEVDVSHWGGDGVGSSADLVIEGKTTDSDYNARVGSGAFYITI